MRPVDGNMPTSARGSRHTSPLQWLRREGVDLTITSLGDYCLPFLLAALEACWSEGILIGLASLDFLHSPTALLPFWGPPLLVLVALWLFRRALQKEAQVAHETTGEAREQGLFALPGLRLLVVVLALLTIVLIWLHIYSPAHVLFDPRWLLAFVGDLLALNTNLYQAVIIIAIALYFCWRGMRLAQLTVEPGHVLRQLWVGLLILLVAVLMRAGRSAVGGSADDLVLVLLIPVFLYLALSAHALARITFIRREHPIGLEGSVLDQERAMVSMIAGVGLMLLLLTILGSAIFSPNFFAATQPLWQALGAAYDVLARVLAQVISWLATPLFWLYGWLVGHFQGTHPRITPPVSPVGNGKRKLPPVAATSPAIILAVKIALPLLLLLLLALLVWFVVHRRKRVRIALKVKGGDLHESVWSWLLFWGQFRAFCLNLWHRLFPKRAANEPQAASEEDQGVSPSARTMREIYRALLKKAATRGHARKRDETPHEFRQRLHEHESESEPQLGLLTEAYAQTRYGGTSPTEHELTTARNSWDELERKWEG